MASPPGDNFNYVVLERDTKLTEQDRRYYETLLSTLRADVGVVESVTDLMRDPVAAPGAQSADGHATHVMVKLAGSLGTAPASSAVEKVRATITRTPTPSGLSVYLTGPGATIADEFAAIDRQILTITAATVALILLLLLIVYRSPVTAAIPLVSVGLALAVARPIVAALGDAGFVEISLFSIALLAAMMLGAGTDYGIFLIGRYQESRRRGYAPILALSSAYRSIAPVISGSALTIAVALTALGFAKVGMLRSAGMPCAIGIVVAMSASLTLSPALLALAAARGYVDPRGTAHSARRWRRVGVVVARWPGPVLVVSAGLVLALALPLLGMRIGWDEPAATPANVESNRGNAAMDRHFPVNRLFPAVVTVVADHDLRNPGGLIAIERISRQLMQIPDVQMVQSASRPGGSVPEDATLSYQAGLVGRQLDDSVDALTERLQRVGELDQGLASMQLAVDKMSTALSQGTAGFAEINLAASDMSAGMDGLQHNVTSVSGDLDPLRDFVRGRAFCDADFLCAAANRVVAPVDDLVRSSADLSSGAAKLTSGSDAAATALDGLREAVPVMSTALSQARSAIDDVTGVAGAMGPQLRQLTDYLKELDAQFAGSAASGFYLPQRALTDPRFNAAVRELVSADGRATRVLVYGNGREWGPDGAARSHQIDIAVREATKEGTLRPVEVDLNGVGPATHDLQSLVARDMRLLVGSVLVLIFAIMAVMLRSPVVAGVVVGTVVVSYASALGASVLIWQNLLGHELHWAVPAISLIALVAVGADYNLLLALRLREESRVGIKTGVIRTFAGTGGVVTTAGIVFGLTMAALVGSTVLSVAQIGSTIAVGLLVDTLLVRTFIVPSVAVLLGRWFWWPYPVVTRSGQRHAESGRTASGDLALR